MSNAWLQEKSRRKEQWLEQVGAASSGWNSGMSITTRGGAVRSNHRGSDRWNSGRRTSSGRTWLPARTPIWNLPSFILLLVLF
jgi:hypothetical protein